MSSPALTLSKFLLNVSVNGLLPWISEQTPRINQIKNLKNVLNVQQSNFFWDGWIAKLGSSDIKTETLKSKNSGRIFF